MDQWRALSRQMPLMYLMLVCNTLTVAWMHLGDAPPLYTIYVPGGLVLLCCMRLAAWWSNRDNQVCAGTARKRVRVMIGLSVALSVCFVAWGLSLFQYGSSEQRFHLLGFMALTTVGCALCLMHVRIAALLVAVIVAAPYVTFLAGLGGASYIALAINLVAVLATLAFVIVWNHRDFSALVASRNAMAQRQAETQRLLEENHRLANLDALTGLPNRRHFDRHFQAALEAADSSNTPIGVARVDIDNFKTVNQLFGQITGDQVLGEIAQRLGALISHGSFLARLDADKFAIVFAGPISRDDLNALGQSITSCIAQTFYMSLGDVRITASAGLAVSEPGDTPDRLFDRADYATWVAKRDARGESVVFSRHHARELIQVRRMEEQLYTADLDTEIHILLQPQYDMALGQTVGVEVLARWKSPVLGDVSPADFIPMAERIGKISHITQIVLRKALAISEVVPAPLRLSVNLSANDIGSATAIDKIVAQVSAHPRPPRIDFELTETAVMRDLAQANQSLLALLRLGARIALDDFGTGHSSLTHVQQLPLHQIKIDRSFVSNITTDVTSRAIVQTMIDLCRNLGMECIFEGVETEAQLETLVNMGARVIQGYLFGRPMTTEALLDYLAHEQRRNERDHRSVTLEAVG
ncbi:EAL domain-containing protein [Devosia sp. SD17-2]|uniref:putative bifunctional diguanylate cyclase/phosphodiesterase n=1 Tax=Devosia sp. SD17-2 TaxID=2976459 RepID=UPI0023D7F24E|nr:EAL domain-containing protein [Devosia sp. SD17-2]WEJ32339.1 EAL domain-containing protein [Devosia sp. SD17-2]